MENENIHVKVLLVTKNIKQKQIAQRFFIDPSEVNKVVKGTRKTPHIRQAIAISLDMRVEEIWKN